MIRGPRYHRNADAGLGILAAARALKLDFIPLAQESYQLVIPEEHFETPKIKALLEVVGSGTFKKTVEGLGGYSIGDSGKVVYEQ